MRTTVVPAQVTTVEDKIAGNLGLSQLLLLTLPVFGGSALFLVNHTVHGGPPVLDIGGEIGAMVVLMEPATAGSELRLRSEREPPIAVHTGVWTRPRRGDGHRRRLTRSWWPAATGCSTKPATMCVRS